MSAWRPSSSRVGLLTAMLLLPALVGVLVELPTRSASADGPPPNIILILTDDQRADTLQYMPIVRQTLGKHGVTFTNAYVSNPVCCPSRASILTGLYSHTTGVYTNNFAGGFAAFDDSSTIATWLNDAGYHTGLFGKYLNGYETEYIPPGWDRWFAMHVSASYYRYQATSDGIIVQYGNDPADYGTSVVGAATISFIRETPAEDPLFAYVSVPAPHDPAKPAPGDEEAFRGLAPWRPPSYNERDVKDKPQYIRDNPWLKADRRREIDIARIREIRSLVAVDRLVGDIVDVLRETGRLENSIVVFTSDNGVMWGEHRWDLKDVPYEESIAVPMVIRYDGMIPEAREDKNLVTNLDLAPTFAEAAGVITPATEGVSLLPLLLDPAMAWRDGFLIEHMASHGGNSVPSYCGFHTKRYVLIRYSGDKPELYDLKVDRWQRENVIDAPAYAQVVTELQDRLVESCDPPPPGMTID
ncbi:MAG: sulfatase [Actinobacteria bacterium]|nr:sulfatase [Actinomycetota bacterium]